MKIQLSFLIIIIIIFVLTRIYKNEKYDNIIQKKEQSIFTFLKYMDRYYVVNIRFTLSCVFLFIVGNISIFFLLRFFYKMNFIALENTLFKMENETITLNFIYIFNLFGYLLLSLIVIVFYKILLNTLFFDEIIKFHLYCHEKIWYKKLRLFCQMNYITTFFGSFYLFFYNVSKLRIITSLNINETEEFDSYSYIYDRNIVLQCSKLFVMLAKKYKSFFWLFMLIKILFRWLYIHVRFYNGVIPLLPYFIFINISLYGVIITKNYNLLHAIFILYMINLVVQFGKFCDNNHSYYNYNIFKYFYNNEISYREQRLLLKNDITLFAKNFHQSETNDNLYQFLTDNKIQSYVLNKFNDVPQNSEYKIRNKNFNSMYKRWLILVTSLFISYNIISMTNTLTLKILSLNINIYMGHISIFIFLLALICSKKACKYKEPLDDAMDFDWEYYKFNRYYNICFWILIIPQLLLSIILLFMNVLPFYDETIIKKFGLKIIRHFTINEKITFFNKYYEELIKRLTEEKYPIQTINTLELFKEELNLLDIITEKTKLKEIKYLIDDILTLYTESYIKIDTRHKIKLTVFSYFMDIRNEIIEQIQQIEQRRLRIRSIMDTFIIKINILALSKVTADFIATSNRHRALLELYPTILGYITKILLFIIEKTKK